MCASTIIPPLPAAQLPKASLRTLFPRLLYVQKWRASHSRGVSAANRSRFRRFVDLFYNMNQRGKHQRGIDRKGAYSKRRAPSSVDKMRISEKRINFGCRWALVTGRPSVLKIYNGCERICKAEGLGVGPRSSAKAPISCKERQEIYSLIQTLWFKLFSLWFLRHL